MPTIIRTCGVALVVLGLSLAVLWVGCNVTIEVAGDGNDGTQVGGSTPDNPGGTTGGDTTTPPDDPTAPTSEDGNPNSPCADKTNVYVTYKNEASVRVGFVEAFRDDANASLAGSMVVLEPAGKSGGTQNKCITCPNQAGIRNLQYVLNGSWTWVQYPDDLFRGEFKCGDHITFVFNDGGSVTAQVETP